MSLRALTGLVARQLGGPVLRASPVPNGLADAALNGDAVTRRLFDATHSPGQNQLEVVMGKRKREHANGGDADASNGIQRVDAVSAGGQAAQGVPEAKRKRGGEEAQGARHVVGLSPAHAEDEVGSQRSVLDALWQDAAPRRVRQRLEADTAVPVLVDGCPGSGSGQQNVRLPAWCDLPASGGHQSHWAAATRVLFTAGRAPARGALQPAGQTPRAAALRSRGQRALPPAVAQLLRGAKKPGDNAPELRPLPGDEPPPPPPPPPPPAPAVMPTFTPLASIPETAAPGGVQLGGVVAASPLFGAQEVSTSAPPPKRVSSFGKGKGGKSQNSSDSLLGAALSEMQNGTTPSEAPPPASSPPPPVTFTFGAAAPAATPGENTTAGVAGAASTMAPETGASAAAPTETKPAALPFTFGSTPAPAVAATPPPTNTVVGESDQKEAAPAAAATTGSLFTFGASTPSPSTTSAPPATPSFTFGAAAAAAPAPAPAPTAAAPASPAPFAFGAAAPAAAPSPSAPNTGAAFVFGQPTAPTAAAVAAPAVAPAPFAFGSAPVAAAPATVPFAFGAPPPASSAVSPLVSAPSMPASGGFGFGAAAPVGQPAGAPPGAFAFGAPPAAQMPPAAFAPQPASQLAHAFSAPPGLGMPGFGGSSSGGLAALANATPGGMGGFNAGAAPAVPARRPMMKAKRPIKH